LYSATLPAAITRHSHLANTSHFAKTSRSSFSFPAIPQHTQIQNFRLASDIPRTVLGYPTAFTD
jgi:hypothetical protein